MFEAQQEITLLTQKQEQYKQYEKKYLEMLNKQNRNLHVLKKMFTNQVNNSVKIQTMNSKLHLKLSYYIKNSKINQDELEELVQMDLVNEDLVNDVNKWLDLKEGEVNQVDFYEPELELDGEDDNKEMKEGTKLTHKKFGMLVPIMEKKIERPHVLMKSHSYNKDVRGRERNEKTFKDLVSTKEEGCMVDDLILYESKETQTDISFVGRQLESFITTQKELKMLLSKKRFGIKLMSIVGNREETNFVRDKEMLIFLEEQLPMYADEDIGEYYEKNFKGIGFLKSTDINPSLKIKEILTSYAYECHRATIFKTKKDGFEMRADLLHQACLKFKRTLKELDEKYSSIKFKLKEFKQLHRGCPYTIDFKKYTEKGINPNQVRKKKKKKRKNKFDLKPQQRINELKATIEKIVQINKIPGDQVIKAQTPFKQIYKQVNDFLFERASEMLENDEEKDIPLINSLVDYLAKLFGVSGLADKRQKEFFATLFKYKNNKKILLFMRFLGMDSKFADYTDMEYKLYSEAIAELIIQAKRVIFF